MDAASARRQAESLEALRRLEDVLGDVNRETVRLEGLSRKILEVAIDANEVARRTHEATIGTLELLLDELKALRENVPWPGERGSR